MSGDGGGGTETEDKASSYRSIGLVYVYHFELNSFPLHWIMIMKIKIKLN